MVSTHSRPKAAGFSAFAASPENLVSTHSRPKAADGLHGYTAQTWQFQHTAARRRLLATIYRYFSVGVFQHTAARRRLVVFGTSPFRVFCFNTQPPEGG